MKLVKLDEHLYVPEDFTKYHHYYADAEGTKEYTGVTTILSCIAKPALIPWAVKMCTDYIQDNYTGELTDELIKEAKSAHRKKKEDAGAKGTDVHEQIEHIIKNAIENYDGVIPFTLNDEIPQVKNFLNWASSKKVKFLASEKQLYSKTHWIAGTCDFTCEIEDRRYVGDLKTSSGIWPEMFFQVAAYRMMLEEMGEEEYTGSIIVRCGKDGKFETQERFNYDSDLKGFLGALELYRALSTFK